MICERCGTAYCRHEIKRAERAYNDAIVAHRAARTRQIISLKLMRAGTITAAEYEELKADTQVANAMVSATRRVLRSLTAAVGATGRA